MNQLFASTKLDTTSLKQEYLNLENRVRTNPLPWKGQFSPELAEQLLTAYAPTKASVLDPFAGSGTSLLEAARLGYSAIGIELNPAAVLLSKVYTLINLDLEARANAVREIERRLAVVLNPITRSIFGADRGRNQSELECALVDLWRECKKVPEKDLAAALIVLADFHRTLSVQRIQKLWGRLKETVCTLPNSSSPVSIHHADARSLPNVAETIDVVLTSPPYLNVHNYHQQYRRSVEALAYDVLGFARSEIGSNRQNRMNRFLTVIQYSLDMALSLMAIAQVMRPGALSILVVGRESTVCGVPFCNGELIAEIAVRGVGLHLERRQERVFRNRFGKLIYEDILHFRHLGDIADSNNSIETARCIAVNLLLSKLQTLTSSEPNSQLLSKALERSNEVKPSPVFTPESSVVSDF